MQSIQQLIDRTALMQALYALVQEGSTPAEEELKEMLHSIISDTQDQGLTTDDMREIVRAANSRISDIALA